MTKLKENGNLKTIEKDLREGHHSSLPAYVVNLDAAITELRDACEGDRLTLQMLEVLKSHAGDFYSSLTVFGSAEQRRLQQVALETVEALGEVSV